MKSLLAVILSAGLFAAATGSAMADCGPGHNTTADAGKSQSQQRVPGQPS